jgi:PilZ domain
MEHRWGNRQDVNRVVDIGTRSGALVRGKVRNVSLSGAFVQADVPVGLFSYVKIQFVGIRGGESVATQIEGQVVRQGSGGFGIEWLDFATEAVRLLTDSSTFEVPCDRGQWARPRRRDHSGHFYGSK